ncbi:MAG: tetratricopeptide repeat protein [Rhodospirillales bacterium]|jgi:tetratricopeptide (TPR) repeat protein
MTPTETEKLLTEAAQLFQAGKFDDAEAACIRLLENIPEQPQALQLLGFIYFGKQQPDTAIDYLVRSTQAAPDNIEAHFNLARAYEELGDIEQAVSSYRTAHACLPEDLEALSALGRALAKQGHFEDAEGYFSQAVAQSPETAACHVNLANVLSSQRRHQDAEDSYRNAINIDSQLAPAFNGLGQAQLGQGQIDDALASIHQAIALNPDFADAHVTRGNALKAKGQILDAIQSYQMALKIAPDNTDAHFNLSIALFLSGELAEGWTEYEWRWQWKFMASPKRPLPQPAWQNESLANTSVIVWGEQGIGDEIMFASLLPDLIEEASSVTVECEPRLLPIYKRSFPDIDLIPKEATPSSKLLNQSADFQIAIGSLGQRYRPSIDAFPKHDGYLKADADQIKNISNQYRTRFPGKRLIGISWKSGNEELGAMRSATLDMWQPVFQHADCAFINVQYGDVHAELENFSRQTGVEIHEDQAVDPLTDMDAFAAQLAALDLIISIDNSTVHLTGALGLPTWTLLPTIPDWRWMLESSTSHWYPAMRLFRQQTTGEWDDVFNQISKALESN